MERRSAGAGLEVSDEGSAAMRGEGTPPTGERGGHALSGGELNIAEGTEKNHMTNVLGKLGALDRTQAALRTRELGLI